jgi:hypothetical protein
LRFNAIAIGLKIRSFWSQRQDLGHLKVLTISSITETPTQQAFQETQVLKLFSDNLNLQASPGTGDFSSPKCFSEFFATVMPKLSSASC